MTAEPPRTVTWPSATTRPVALLGDPVDHSLSPRLHNAAFRALDLDLVYLALPVPRGSVAEVVTALGLVGAVGANVTVPHKLEAFAACDVVTDAAATIGAVNTLWWQDGALHGDTTDVSGFRRVLDEFGGADGPAVVLGAGGAARAAALALTDAGADVSVVARRVEAAVEVAGIVDGRSLALDDPAVVDAVADARVVVNATPLGMHGEDLPAAFGDVGEGQVAHDLVYVDGTTPWLAGVAGRGGVAVDGRPLLAAQAEDAFTRWTGQRPPTGLFRDLLA